MQEYIEQLLYSALDFEITEFNFWEMTIAEVIRAIESKQKREKIKAQEKASYDYIQANLIGKIVSIILTGKGVIPKIEEVYNELFDDVIEEREAKLKEKQAELSALRFRQFAQSFNKRINKEGANGRAIKD